MAVYSPLISGSLLLFYYVEFRCGKNSLKFYQETRNNLAVKHKQVKTFTDPKIVAWGTQYPYGAHHKRRSRYVLMTAPYTHSDNDCLQVALSPIIDFIAGTAAVRLP